MSGPIKITPKMSEMIEPFFHEAKQNFDHYQPHHTFEWKNPKKLLFLFYREEASNKSVDYFWCDFKKTGNTQKVQLKDCFIEWNENDKAKKPEWDRDLKGGTYSVGKEGLIYFGALIGWSHIKQITGYSATPEDQTKSNELRLKMGLKTFLPKSPPSNFEKPRKLYVPDITPFF